MGGFILFILSWVVFYLIHEAYRSYEKRSKLWLKPMRGELIKDGTHAFYSSHDNVIDEDANLYLSLLINERQEIMRAKYGRIISNHIHNEFWEQMDIRGMYHEQKLHESPRNLNLIMLEIIDKEIFKYKLSPEAYVI